MFDANACYLKRGTKFFASVYSKGALKESEIRDHGVVACTKLTQSPREDCRIRIHLTDRSIDVDGNADMAEHGWFVYIGQHDLTDFVYDEDLQKARALLAEFNPWE